jgi:hypothetical protein
VTRMIKDPGGEQDRQLLKSIACEALRQHGCKPEGALEPFLQRFQAASDEGFTLSWILVEHLDAKPLDWTLNQAALEYLGKVARELA